MRGLYVLIIALIAFVASPAYADDTSQANLLFVEAVKMIDQADTEKKATDRANLYELAVERLERIVLLHPGSDIAANLIARGRVGRINMSMVEAQARIARLEVQLAARRDDPALANLLAEINTLEAENAELSADNASLSAEIAALEAENADLDDAIALPVTEAAVASTVIPEPTAEPTPEPAAALTSDDIMAGVRDALRVGTENVVGQLGAVDGFNGDPAIHIPLPDSLKQVTGALQMVGAAGLTEDLELKINRAAEDATPAAKELFWQAITDMSIDDIEGIFNGPDDAATQYFKGAMSDPLADAMRPIIDQSLAQVGAVQAFESMMGNYKSIPFVPDVKADLTEHTLAAAIEGIFHYLGEEEAAIRNDAVNRTTELLQRVFGGG